MRNPYGGQIYHVGLKPEDVDGFVAHVREVTAAGPSGAPAKRET